MKRLSTAAMAIMLAATMLFGACAKSPEDEFGALNPVNTANAQGNSLFTPLAGTRQTTDLDNDITFTSRILTDGMSEDLIGGTITAPVITLAEKTHYIYRTYPPNLSEPVSEYDLTFTGLRLIEAYGNHEPGVCSAHIPLTGSEDMKLVPRAMAANADGFTVLYTVFGMNADGTAAMNSMSRAVTQYDMDGQERATIAIAPPDGETPWDVFAINGAVYVQTMRYDPNEQDAHLYVHGKRTLYTVDMASGELTPLTIDPFIAATTYADGQLLLMSLQMDEGTRTKSLRLDVLDVETGETTPLSAVIIDDSDIVKASITYDAKTGALYFICSGIIHCWLVDTASPIFPISEIPAHSLLAVDKNLLVLESNGAMHLLSSIELTKNRISLTDENRGSIAFGLAPKADESDAVTIRILTDSQSLFNEYTSTNYLDYIEKYMRDVLGVSIKLEQVQISADYMGNYEYQDKLAGKLLAGDSTFDMFLLCPSQDSLRNKAYFQSFEDYDVARHFDAMLPGVRELCEIDGQLSLIPLTLEVPALQIHMDMAAAAGIDYTEIPGTANEFLDFMEANRENLTDAGVFVYEDSLYWLAQWYMPTYVIEFMEKREGDGRTFYDMLSVLDQIQEQGLFKIINDENGYENTLLPSQMLVRGKFGLVGASSPTFHMGIDNISLPKLYADAPVPLDRASKFLGVNPLSKNAEIVQLITETLVDIEFQRYVHTEAGSFERKENLVQYNGEYSCNNILYDYPEYADSRNFGLYKEALAHSAWYNVHMWRGSDSNEAFVKYYNGEITAEAFKAIVDRELEFLRDE